jgi:tRNA (guanosine-2'-O-)-methyltransferase
MVKSILESKLPSKEVIKRLEPLLLEKRKKRIDQVLEGRIKGLSLAVEAPSCIYNALACIRTAEAFGIDQFHLIESEMRRRQGKKSASGSHKWVDIYQYSELDNFLKQIKDTKTTLIGTVPSGGLALEEVPISNPTCLLLGNEHRGLSDKAIKACDLLITIPMVGMVESFNIANAAAIATYVLQEKWRASGQNIAYSASEIEAKKAEFYIKTVGQRVASGALKD